MTKPYHLLRIVLPVLLFAIPFMSYGRGEPIPNATSIVISNSKDSTYSQLGHCDPVIVPVFNCTTGTIELGAYISWLFTGLLEPVVVTWSTGQVAHKITVVPPGTWSWDASFTGCEPYHWQNEFTADESIFAAPGATILISPIDGETGVSTNAQLTWAAVPDANSYQVEVATSPLFSAASLVFIQTVDTTSVTASGLQEDIIYYWRVKAINGCGSSDYTGTAAFQTGNSLCLTKHFDYFDNVEIDSFSVNTVNLSLGGIPDNQIVESVSIGFFIEHSWVGDLSARLISPSNDTLLLFDRPGVEFNPPYGCEGDDASLSFSDQGQAPGLLENQCNMPPLAALNGNYRPALEPFSIFSGNIENGSWTLAVTDDVAGDGGHVRSSNFTICYHKPIVPGTILVNNPLHVILGQSGNISQSLLSMGISASPNQGLFILLSLPQHGILTLNGVTLIVGSTFTQADINNGYLNYTHSGDNATTDNFHFDAIDQNNDAWVHDGVFNININDGIITATAAITSEILCHNDMTGEISVTANGGQSPYAFSLNGGANQASNVFSDLPPGVYTVLVTDNAGISVSTIQIILPNPPPVVPTLSGPQFLCPEGDTALVQVNQPWNAYEWADGSTTNAITITEPGLYIAIVTDQFGCTGEGFWGVQSGEVGAFSIEMTAPSICMGALDTLRVLGGFTQYQWSNNVTGSTNIVDQAGTYTVTVTNIYGCTGTGSATVGLTPSYSLSTSVNSLTVCIGTNAAFGTNLATVCSVNSPVSLSVTGAPAAAMVNISPNPLMPSDMATITLSGLTAGMAGNYVLTVTGTNGSYTQAVDVSLTIPPAISVNPTIACDELTINAVGGTGALQYSINGGAFQNSNIFPNLVNGNYTIVVLDENGCNAETSATMAASPLLLDPPTVQPIGCAGGDDGAIILSASGGQPPYSFSLNGGTPQASNTFNNLSAGSYSIVVTENSSCSTISTGITLSDPTALAIMVNTNANAVTILASGGTGFLEYSLDGLNFQVGNQFSNLCIGAYTAIVRDQKGCVETAPFNISFSDLTGTVEVTQSIDCADGVNGEISVLALGGQAPYSFSLNGGTSQTSNVFSNLAPGTYTIQITDNAGCATTATPTTLNNPESLQIAAVANGSTVTVQASGGTGFLEYSIDGINFQAGNQFFNLANATYTLIVRDENGCTASTNLEVMVGTVEPVEAWGLNVSPNPGAGLFRVTLQNAPEVLRGDIFDITGRLLQSIDLQPIGGKLNTTLHLEHLPKGTYLFRLSDGKNWGSVKLCITGGG